MKLTRVKNIIKNLIKEQSSATNPAGPVASTMTATPQPTMAPASTLGTYTAVVHSSNNKVNIKCPAGQEVRLVAAYPNPPQMAPPFGSLAGQVLGIQGSGVIVQCIGKQP